ncbi:MAG: hypothetical protein KAT40_07100 [Bacteroidales bacterium]|nr:hypothetical protein [Bacteroidales bacterium]
MKCDACRACPAGKNDRAWVKFEVRKYFIREGAYFTVEEGRRKKAEGRRQWAEGRKCVL